MSSVVWVDGTPLTKTIRLTTALGVPVLGLTSSDITLTEMLPGTGAILGASLSEISNGFYTLELDPDIFPLGRVEFLLSTPTAAPQAISALIVSPAAVVPAPAYPIIDTTMLFGFVLDSLGAPIAGAKVAYKLMSSPTLVGGAAIGNALKVSVTNASGYFSFDPLVGAMIEIIIPSIGFRRTLTVPTVSSNIFTLP